MIPQSTIRQIKNQNLVTYLKSRGLQLTPVGAQGKKEGREYLTLCPFHDDHNPSLSVNPANNLWHCFACDMGGDVIKFVELYDKVNFNQAIETLNKNLGGPAIKNGQTKDRGLATPVGGQAGVHGGSPARSVLLEDVFNFYCKSFKDSKPAQEYLKGRGLNNPDLFKKFSFGFADGSLLKTLNTQQKKELKKIGLLTNGGREFFIDCIIYPLRDEAGKLVNLYGRHIFKDGHFYLPGELNGLYYPPKQTDSIIITESIIDALTLHNAGIHNVLPIYGVNGLTENHIFYFQQQRIKEVTLCLDADESGRKAAVKLKEKLEGLGLYVLIRELPEGLDINDYFLKYDKASFLQLLKGEEHTTDESKPSVVDPGIVGETKIDEGYIFNFPERAYRVLGLNPHGLERLKVNLKVSRNGSFHIDTFDLYASRARMHFIDTASKLLEDEPKDLLSEVNILIEQLEQKRLQNLNGHEDKQPEMSEQEKEEALQFLKAPEMFDTIQKDFENCGYIGEEPARLFGYLSMISRFLSQPLGVLIVSRSAAGKSFLQDAISHFVDPADLQKYTRITGQSLFYKEQDALKNKVLAIAEEKGAEDAIYSIRTLQSDQYLTVAVTVTDPQTGQKKTEEYKVEGPVVIIITTTNPEALDFETRNRFVILTIDESREQTKKILQRQREADSLEGLIKQNKEEHIYKKHHNAQRLLSQIRRGGKPVQVVNPFHDKLTYPDNQLQMRREQKKYLTLIKSIAFLRQYQREVKTINSKERKIKYIEVTADDIAIANNLAASILGRSLDELSPHTRGLLQEIKKMVDEFKGKQSEIRFTRKQICDYTGWSYWQIRSHLEQLSAMEYLHLHSGKQGQRHSYELLWDGSGESGEKFMAGLIDIKTLRKPAKTLQSN